jgi:hypothetical protein
MRDTSMDADDDDDEPDGIDVREGSVTLEQVSRNQLTCPPSPGTDRLPTRFRPNALRSRVPGEAHGDNGFPFLGFTASSYPLAQLFHDFMPCYRHNSLGLEGKALTDRRG